jgi:hypothetical protein
MKPVGAKLARDGDLKDTIARPLQELPKAANF